jgi:tetratricopeptide (TPR) repeat protein
MAKVELAQAQNLRRLGGSRKEIEDIYNRLSQRLENALDLVETTPDDPLKAGILYDLALHALLQKQSNLGELVQQLETLLEKHNWTFRLEHARLIELKGNLLHREGEYEQAFSHYIQACRILAEYNPASFQRNFERMRNRFLDADPKVQVQVCGMINDKLKDVPPTSLLLALRSLCVDELADL